MYDMHSLYYHSTRTCGTRAHPTRLLNQFLCQLAVLLVFFVTLRHAVTLLVHHSKGVACWCPAVVARTCEELKGFIRVTAQTILFVVHEKQGAELRA